MPLNDEHLNILKKPFGKLIKQDEISKEKINALVKDYKSLITVGDASTEKIISYGLMPNLSIIDVLKDVLEEQNRKYQNLQIYSKTVLVISNNTIVIIQRVRYQKKHITK